MIIVLGESVLALITAADHTWTAAASLVAVLGFVLLAALWWLYRPAPGSLISRPRLGGHLQGERAPDRPGIPGQVHTGHRPEHRGGQAPPSKSSAPIDARSGSAREFGVFFALYFPPWPSARRTGRRSLQPHRRACASCADDASAGCGVLNEPSGCGDGARQDASDHEIPPARLPCGGRTLRKAGRDRLGSYHQHPSLLTTPGSRPSMTPQLFQLP
ncbi:low temperature requirement protein A, partial [Streptomyces sp. NPDC005209]|uniref:low temperature requirement protein A n=1 Tax=Streptomyces sp. NPDC005209 TaxID=3156715 RepID=UPI0033A3B3CA